MAAIITNKFRIHNAEQFKEGFSEAAATNMYLFIGRPQPWASETSPDTPIDTLNSEYEIWRDMIALKRIQSSDVSHVIVKTMWTAGKYYDVYRHNYNGSSGQGVDINTGVPTTRSNLFDANFFVVTDEYSVYKCLDNRNSLGVVAPSTIKPNGTSLSPFTTADGYKWKYMYSLSGADAIKFVSTDFIPVKYLSSNPGPTDQYYNQWLVQDSSLNGGIENILTTSGGSGYTSAPTITITGDGENATATAVIDSGSVVGVNITNSGTGYTYAAATISGGGGSGAALEVIISPIGGHGSDPVKELGGFYVMMNVRLEYDDGAGDFPVNGDYRRIGIIKDPYNYGTTTVATNYTLIANEFLIMSTGGTGTFSVDEVITGSTSGAKAKVVSYDSTTKMLRYIQTIEDGSASFSVGETVTGGSSTATASIASLGNPEVQPYSGDIIYVENRRAIERASDQVEDIKLVVEM